MKSVKTESHCRLSLNLAFSIAQQVVADIKTGQEPRESLVQSDREGQLAISIDAFGCSADPDNVGITHWLFSCTFTW